MSDVRLVVITGLSGAGKTEASRALEDMGFFVVDNLPPALIATFADLCRGSRQIDRAALVVDARGGEFFADALAALQQLRARGVRYEILFLQAEDETLILRYKESRRQHPMAPHGRVADGIAEERRLLAPLHDRADYVLATDSLRQGGLRAQLRQLFGAPAGLPLRVTVISFGFKYGLPPDADLVLDVRFLPNPHYDPRLRERSGLDAQVAAYVLERPETGQFLALARPLLDFLLPHYQAEGRAEVVLAIGCTGGRHRSVALAASLGEHLRGGGRTVEVVHRDVDRVDAEVDADAGV